MPAAVGKGRGRGSEGAGARENGGVGGRVRAGVMKTERVEIIDVDDYTEPAAEPGYYAIYLRLSHEPSPAWKACLEREWLRIPTALKRRAAVVRDRLRIEISGDDRVQEQLDFAAHLVERTNRAIAATHPKSMKESAARD